MHHVLSRSPSTDRLVFVDTAHGLEITALDIGVQRGGCKGDRGKNGESKGW